MNSDFLRVAPSDWITKLQAKPLGVKLTLLGDSQNGRPWWF